MFNGPNYSGKSEKVLLNGTLESSRSEQSSGYKNLSAEEGHCLLLDSASFF